MHHKTVNGTQNMFIKLLKKDKCSMQQMAFGHLKFVEQRLFLKRLKGDVINSNTNEL
jgi:hypothetical protein